jgi:predicted secreted acid phosphatase
MNRGMVRGLSVVLLLCSLTAHGQQAVVTVAGEPENLQMAKDRLTAYQSCQATTCYQPQLKRQIQVAMDFLKAAEDAAKPGEKLALVLDIDETSLSNWATEQLDDFGYILADSNKCVTDHCAKAIPETLALFNEAVTTKKVKVFFITGRPEAQRADTVANLKAEGYSGWEHLSLRAADHPKDQSTIEYKSGERRKIVAEGYRIVLNVGDQMSDLVGDPMAEHSVKLPNPFYLLP